jgi:hypothetical protein
VIAALRCSPGATDRGAGMTIIALVLMAVVAGLSASTSAGAIVPRASSTYAVPAVRQPLTTDPASPVVHDTETDVLVAQGARLFASTDQWEYPGSRAYGQILVKNSAKAPWKVFEQTQGLRVEDSMASFPIPRDQGMGRGHSLLITAATLDGYNELQWLLDGAKSFSPADSFPLPSDVTDVRSFGAHEIGGVWSVYAGVDPTGILRATWSKALHSLIFGPTPELTVAPVSSPNLVSRKSPRSPTAAARSTSPSTPGSAGATTGSSPERHNDGRCSTKCRRSGRTTAVCGDSHALPTTVHRRFSCRQRATGMSTVSTISRKAKWERPSPCARDILQQIWQSASSSPPFLPSVACSPRMAPPFPPQVGVPSSTSSPRTTASPRCESGT